MLDASSSVRPIDVHMTGSEWFGSRPGGLNRYFEDLFQALQSAGANVSASAFGEAPTGGTSWGTAQGSTTSRIIRSMNGPRGRPGLVTDRHFSLYGRQPYIARSKSSLVVHFQGPWAAESSAAGHGNFRTAIKERIEKLRYREAGAFVVLSDGFGRILVERYGIDEDKIQVIPPGVNLDKFVLRRSLPTAPNVLCVRRLERRMGIHVLLDAWPDVLRAQSEATLTIVGTGTEEENLRRQAAILGINSSVRFTGRVSDGELPRLYEDALCTVVPSVDLEGFGLIALESLAVGRAPIVTACGGLPDAVKGLDETLIVSIGDSEELSKRVIDAIAGAIPSPEDCRRHAEGFAWANVAEKHIDLYRSLA